MKKINFILVFLATFCLIPDTINAKGNETKEATRMEMNVLDPINPNDKFLGKINPCSQTGESCNAGLNAYESSENGRIYVIWGNGTFWAQKSDDSRWEYRFYYDSEWYYFSL